MVVATESFSVGPRVCSSQQEVEGSHKVLYYRPTKNERIIYYSHLFGFLFTKQQERKMQEADGPGAGVRNRRARGMRTAVTGDGNMAGWFRLSLQAPWGSMTAREGADPRVWERLSPGQQQHHSPGGRLAVSRAGSTGGSVLGGLASKQGPSGPDRREGAGRGLHRTEFYQGPPRTPGPPAGKSVRFLSCSSGNQLLHESLQLILILDAHKLVHHVPVLDGQHGGHS